MHFFDLVYERSEKCASAVVVVVVVVVVGVVFFTLRVSGISGALKIVLTKLKDLEIRVRGLTPGF